ncbi:MAG: DUF4139 domain-containing protein [Actinomycetales bacterium]
MTALDAPIVAVTVYPGNARIQRTASLTVPEGRHRLTVVGLPVNLDPESVRITGHGGATIRAVDVRVARQGDHQVGSAAGDLAQELREIGTRLAELADSRQGVEAEITALTTLSQRTGHALASAVVHDGLEPNRLDPVLAYVRDALSTAHATRREIGVAEREAQADKQRVERAIGDLGRPAADSMCVDVDLDALGGSLTLDVSYLVPDAGWSSRYDLRLDGERLQVDWIGMVHQNSGETWPAGQLRLSTARPGAAVVMPELDTWYVHDRAARPVNVPRARARAVADAGIAMPAGAMAAAAPMAVATAEAEHAMVASTYRVRRPGEIPPDGGDHQVLIDSFHLPARVDRVTAPVRSDEVIVRAVVTNDSEHTFRPGRAALFHDGEFVGSTELRSWASGERRELALGLDERVRVERKLTSHNASKALVGGTRRYDFTYITTITNHGRAAVDITVLDQLPVPTTADITIRDATFEPEPASVQGSGSGGETTPDPAGEQGLVRWHLHLAKGESARVRLSFRVDAARGAEPLGLRY